MKYRYFTGYAGTGKSTLLAQHIHQVPKDKMVLVIAPTHKALNVLKDKFSPQNVVFSTVHSLLSLRPAINEHAEELRELEITISTGTIKELSHYDYIFIDEAGMIDRKYFDTLLEALDSLPKEPVVNIYLDPYQLTPVKGKQIDLPIEITTELPDSILEAPSLTLRYNLEKQYRSNKSITSFYEQIVHGIKTNKLVNTVIPKELEISYSKAIEQFNPEADIYLAYTNKQVGLFIQDIKNNKDLHHMDLSYQLSQYEVIDIASAPIKYVKIGSKPYTRLGYVHEKYINALDRRVRKSKNLRLIKAMSISPQGDKYDGYALVIEGYYNHYLLNKQVDEYLVNLNKQKKSEEKKQFLPSYYDVKNSFALDYDFARTVHKSQGSEWDNVYVDYTDLQQCKTHSPLTYMRLLYVACSRAKKNLYLITKGD